MAKRVPTGDRAKPGMVGQLASQRWPEVRGLTKRTETPIGFREYVDEQAKREGLAALFEIYGKDVKPEVRGRGISQAVLRAYAGLKERIVQRILDEAGYKGLRALGWLEYTDEEFAIMPKDEEKAQQTVEKEDTRKHEYAETPHGEFRKNSVLHIIYAGLARKGGSTKAELADALEKVHPTPKGEATWAEKSTINCQIDRMHGERGFKLARTAAGKYGIEPGKGSHGDAKKEQFTFSGLEGWDSTRVLSPEAAAKRAEKEKEKAAAKAEKEKVKEAAKAEKAKLKAAEDAKKEKAKAEEAAKQAKLDAADAEKKAKAKALAAK